MFIRRNMSSNVSYQQLKEYPCFRQLAKVIDVMVLKQILPMVVKRVSLDVAKQTLNRNKMMYIPEQNFENNSSSHREDSKFLGGSAIDSMAKQNNKDNFKVRFLMIEIKIYNILKHLFYKQIDCMEHFKNFQKLNFFYRSSLEDVPYGGYVYRKDDKITSIYYLVRGQIKISKSVDQKEISICTVYEDTFFGLHEFSRNKIKRLLNAQSNSNNTIVLSISLDMLTQLFGKDENEVLNKILALPSQIQKINLQETRKLNHKQKKEKNNNFIKAYQFQRRLMKFTEQRTLDRNQSAFGKFAENKSLLFKIKDSNDSIPRLKQETVKVTTNFHKNETSLKYYNRLNQHRLHNLDSTISQSFKDKGKENTNNKSSIIIRPSQLLTSRLKQRFHLSKNHFSNTGFDKSPTTRNSQVW